MNQDTLQSLHAFFQKCEAFVTCEWCNHGDAFLSCSCNLAGVSCQVSGLKLCGFWTTPLDPREAKNADVSNDLLTYRSRGNFSNTRGKRWRAGQKKRARGTSKVFSIALQAQRTVPCYWYRAVEVWRVAGTHDAVNSKALFSWTGVR